ncbi:MAG: TCR/Tet family MFS transporter [Pseudomonadota bacterium]
MNNKIIFIIFTVTLDAMGVGLIMPVMPDLIREVSNTDLSNAAFWGGLLTFTYALMQFLFGPLIGNLSDRFGRRPVLIISLICMGLDYFVMALAPTLWLLFLARAVSGIAGATYSTAAAYLSDISAKGERAANFGLIGAAFGIGFVLGPAIGGLLGEYGIRTPFIAAGVLAILNALFGYFVLPETLRPAQRRTFEWQRANPFAALLRLRHLPTIGSLMLVVFVYSVANHVYPTIWSFYTIEQFQWSLGTVGLSLAIYGVCSATVQVAVLPRMLKYWGEYTTIRVGLLVSLLSFLFLSVIDVGWMIFISMPITAIGAVVGPSLQGMMADRVGDNEQGELQGIFSSVVAISMIFSPLLMTNVFKEFTEDGAVYYLPGAPFAAAAVLAVISAIIFYRAMRSDKIKSS